MGVAPRAWTLGMTGAALAWPSRASCRNRCSRMPFAGNSAATSASWRLLMVSLPKRHRSSLSSWGSDGGGTGTSSARARSTKCHSSRSVSVVAALSELPPANASSLCMR